MATVGLSMIVKNGGEDLQLCLASVRSIVDQIVIADTGSTDHSVAIAREFGATVVSFPWCDDFAAARNAALAPIMTDWVLVLDADEDVPPASLNEIRRLVDLDDPTVGGYTLPNRSYMTYALQEGGSSKENHDDADRARHAAFYIDFPLLRLFRRHPRIVYTGCVHEMVIAPIRQLGLAIHDTDAVVRHYGRLWDQETARRKRDYYIELGRRKIEQEPDNVDAWYSHGIAELSLGHHLETMRCMDRAYRLSRQPLPQALYYIGLCLQREGHLAEALTILAEVPDHGGLGLQKNLLKGDVLHDLNRLEEAGAAYRRALKEVERQPDLRGWQAQLESRHGYVQVRLGNKARGLALLRRALAAAPQQFETHDRLLKACVAAGDEASAADAAEAVLDHFTGEPLVVRAVALRIRLQQPDRAQRLLDAGLHTFPQSVSLKNLQQSLSAKAQPV